MTRFKARRDPDSEGMSFGQLILSRRERLGLGQRALAERLGVTQQTVSRWERSAHLPPPRQFLALVEALETTPTAMLRALGYAVDGHEPAVDELVVGLSNRTTAELLELAIEALRELQGRAET